MPETEYVIRPIGWVESPLVDPDAAPLQGDEGTPDAWLVLDPTMGPAMRDLTVGAEVIVLTWLDRADRDALVVHPRGARPDARRGHQAGARTRRGTMTFAIVGRAAQYGRSSGRQFR